MKIGNLFELKKEKGKISIVPKQGDARRIMEINFTKSREGFKLRR